MPLDLLAGVSEQDWLLADRATAKRAREAFVKEATVHMMNPNILGAGQGVCMEAKREICKVSSNFYFTPPSAASPGAEAPLARYPRWQKEVTGEVGNSEVMIRHMTAEQYSLIL